MRHFLFYPFLFFLFIPHVYSQQLVTVGDGWANNTINVTVFRKNSVVTHNDIQFVAYYDPQGFLILAKRKQSDNKWTVNKTQYKGNVNDAHNGISIMVDGDGYLHVSWDHHGNPLHYSIGVSPYSIELGNMQSMTGDGETNVTYPEFYKMPNGNLIFIYRNGASGNGNLVVNNYDLKTKRWTQLQNNLVDGQMQRNAYWQACVDNSGHIHLSWVWRETADVGTNHDMCYAKSRDGGCTWETSKGTRYQLPINATTSEYIQKIPQNSELINQTSMTTDAKGNPYIATYWRKQNSDVPQYHIIHHDGTKWADLNLNFRTTPFTLQGGGTKSIPISRPQVLAESNKKKTKLMFLFRDAERGSKVSMAICNDIKKNDWIIKDLTNFSVGAWEPSFDTELWRNKGILNVFIQKAEQIDGEGKADVRPEKVQILDVTYNQ